MAGDGAVFRSCRCRRGTGASNPDLKCNPIVGASLLAKAVCQSTDLLNVKTDSRAGSLPQGVLWCLQVRCLRHNPPQFQQQGCLRSELSQQVDIVGR
ncbi:hypothetical protein EMIT0P260_40353 [Pseudomonas sp. IT-P260]